MSLARREIKAIALIGCSSRKLTEASRAARMYQGALFRKSYHLAQLRDEVIFILSAKYELLNPGTLIEPYDLNLRAMGRTQRFYWAKRVAEQLQNEVNDLGWLVSQTEIVFYASAIYREPLADRLAELWCYPRIKLPLKGLGIGQQLAYLTAQTKAMAP